MDQKEHKKMQYRVKVAGKIFEGNDTRILLKLAVAARRGQEPVPVRTLMQSMPDGRSFEQTAHDLN